MKIDSTALATSSEAISAAVAYRAEALASVQQSTLPDDRVTLSKEALEAGDAPPVSAIEAPTSTEEAIADAAVADVGVQAAIKAQQAEEERTSALIFVLAHHGPPLR